MASPVILSIDQGTTSSRSVVYDPNTFAVLGSALATAEIFILLLSELEGTHGIKDLAAARRFQFPELNTDLHG